MFLKHNNFRVGRGPVNAILNFLSAAACMIRGLATLIVALASKGYESCQGPLADSGGTGVAWGVPFGLSRVGVGLCLAMGGVVWSGATANAATLNSAGSITLSRDGLCTEANLTIFSRTYNITGVTSDFVGSDFQRFLLVDGAGIIRDFTTWSVQPGQTVNVTRELSTARTPAEGPYRLIALDTNNPTTAGANLGSTYNPNAAGIQGVLDDTTFDPTALDPDCDVEIDITNAGGTSIPDDGNDDVGAVIGTGQQTVTYTVTNVGVHTLDLTSVAVGGRNNVNVTGASATTATLLNGESANIRVMLESSV